MITIQHLNYSVPDKKILSDFSFHAAPGEKHLVVGRSGTGKTSLFKLILGFVQPDSGTIFVDGHRLSPPHLKEIRQQIFYLSQDVDLPGETGNTLIERVFLLNHLPGPDTRSVQTYLDLLCLAPSLLDKEIPRLSGGERQRVGLLLCFLLNRKIWLLDEPSSALDSEAKAQLAEFICTRENTVIIISHDEVWQNRPEIKQLRWH